MVHGEGPEAEGLCRQYYSRRPHQLCVILPRFFCTTLCHPSHPRAMLICEFSRGPPSTRLRTIYPHPLPHIGSGSEEATGMVLELIVKMLVRVLLYSVVYGFSYPSGRFHLGHHYRGYCHGGGTGEGALQGPAELHRAALANRGFKSGSRSPLPSSMNGADAVRAKLSKFFLLTFPSLRALLVTHRSLGAQRDPLPYRSLCPLLGAVREDTCSSSQHPRLH